MRHKVDGPAAGLSLCLFNQRRVAAWIVHALTYTRRAGREGWWVLLALSIVLIVCGFIVLINPWWSEPTKLFDIIGGMLLFSSLVSIVRLILVWPIKSE